MILTGRCTSTLAGLCNLDKTSTKTEELPEDITGEKVTRKLLRTKGS